MRIPYQQKQSKQRPGVNGVWFSGLLLLGLIWLFWAASPVYANAPLDSQKDSGDDVNHNCLMCHGDPEFKGWFKNGDLISLYIDSGVYGHSVHGPAGLNCVACHIGQSTYPHSQQNQITCLECHDEEGGTIDIQQNANLRVELPYTDHREMTLDKNESCRSCHEQEYEISGPSAHANVFDAGNRDSAVCIDCHGSHDIPNPREPRAKAVQICGDCHKAAYSTYKVSVHGASLTAEANPDVPTCIDCHGVHNVRGPRVTTYRNDTISICGDCHSDPVLMDKYGLSTDVFQTYVSDFHGRTVNLFRRYDPTTPCDKAVCFDCHGIHNIRSKDDPLSTVHPNNLQKTCQLCHENASPSFTLSWLGHNIVTRDGQPIISIINTVYTIMIPAVIGFFLFYISLDVGRNWFEKYRVKKRAHTLAEKELEDNVLGI
jgi:predicted CXXCH cytochrome family protein